jgi:hypothetical protein
MSSQGSSKTLGGTLRPSLCRYDDDDDDDDDDSDDDDDDSYDDDDSDDGWVFDRLIDIFLCW